MSVISTGSLVPLLTSAAGGALGCAAWSAIRRLRRQVAELHRELAEHRAQDADLDAARAAGRLPAARTAADTEAIRSAVADALADERERELTEARARRTVSEVHDPEDTPVLDGPTPEADGRGEFTGPIDPVRTTDPTGDTREPPGVEAPAPFLPRQAEPVGGSGEPPGHPSDPGFSPASSVAGPERTLARLAALAEARTPLADVRPGPLGTLDLYVFADGTTLCLTPGQGETSGRLAAAVRRGEVPVLLGGSGVSGGYALTFTYGSESVFVLADRVVASL